MRRSNPQFNNSTAGCLDVEYDNLTRPLYRSPRLLRRAKSMLDVHPAHHAASTWRDFFIHIATIVLGLLIAIGLEQTVEYLHHRHLRHQLEQDLREEGLKNQAAREVMLRYL